MEMLGQNVQALSSASGRTDRDQPADERECGRNLRTKPAWCLRLHSSQQNLQTVATGTEEMGASIKEIAKSATEAAKVATSAVKVAETANTTVSKLGDSSIEIGQVIKVITSIAQQTQPVGSGTRPLEAAPEQGKRARALPWLPMK